ncbi:hypothetical protein VE02_04535 [Pseudogymnoascus sp. 03VT05]|nr:hypothetical protein VE02_04535 [Pseudogymnoascus sp. 03VT05]
MASVWKGPVEWIDETAIEVDESGQSPPGDDAFSAAERLRDRSVAGKKCLGVGKHVGEKTLGCVEIVKIFSMVCTISGISLYTQDLLLFPATKKKHKSRQSIGFTGSDPSGGLHRRQNNPPPELRLMDLNSQAEVDKDGLSVSRFERLFSGDYHLGMLPVRNAASTVALSTGALEALAGIGMDMWHVAISPKSLFSSGVSVRKQRKWRWRRFHLQSCKHHRDDTGSQSRATP